MVVHWVPRTVAAAYLPRVRNRPWARECSSRSTVGLTAAAASGPLLPAPAALASCAAAARHARSARRPPASSKSTSPERSCVMTNAPPSNTPDCRPPLALRAVTTLAVPWLASTVAPTPINRGPLSNTNDLACLGLILTLPDTTETITARPSRGFRVRAAAEELATSGWATSNSAVVDTTAQRPRRWRLEDRRVVRNLRDSGPGFTSCGRARADHDRTRPVQVKPARAPVPDRSAPGASLVHRRWRGQLVRLRGATG